LGTFLSEIKLSMGVRLLMSGRDGCDDSDDDDEPLVGPASTTTGGFADALTEVEPYIPLTVTSNHLDCIMCKFDLVDVAWAPMVHLSAAIVTQFYDYDGVYCVVPLTEAGGVPQALLHFTKCTIHFDSVMKAFLAGETDLMRFWGRYSTVPLNVRQSICDGLCFKKDLPEILKPHLKHHYHVIRDQCKAQFASEEIINSCTYDDPPSDFFGELLALTSRVMKNIDDQIAAREAMRKAHRDAVELRKAKHLMLRNATPSMDDWERYWGMKHFGREVDGPCMGGLLQETKQCLCDHLGLDSTGRKDELASRLHEYFQTVDLQTHFALFSTDDGERRKRRPNWRSPACGLPPLKRARLAAEELSEEYYGHVCTVQKWARRLVAQTDIVPKRRREWGEDLKRKAREAAEEARVARRAMLHDVVERDHTPDEHATAKKRVRLLYARELIGQGHFRARGAAEANEPEEAEEAAAEPVAEADEEPQDARIGARVEVYWELNDTWFRGRIAGQRYDLGVLELLVEYDDGDSEHHPFHEEEFDGHGAPPPAEDGEPVQWRRV
jgi:hypothetical protein